MQGKVLDKHKSCYSALWGLYFGQHKLKLHIGLHTILSNMDMAHVNFLQKILIFCQTRLHPMDHPSLRNTTFHNVTSSLISPEPQGTDVLILNLHLCCHISSHTSRILTLKLFTKDFQPHTCTNHIVIIIVIVIIAMLTLCYSAMSHATRILYIMHMCWHYIPLYHVHFGCYM